jgi:hypothetical protein
MMTQLLAEQDVDLEKQFEASRLIFEFAVAEVLRQVAVECLERGQLLDRVIKFYIGMLERALRMYRGQAKSLTSKFEETLQYIKAKHREAEETSTQEVKELQRQVMFLNFQLKEKHNDLKAEAEKVGHAVKKMKIVQTHYKHLKKELLVTKELHRVMKASLEEGLVCGDIQSQVTSEVTRKYYRLKEDTEIDKELLQDPALAEGLEAVDRLADEIRKNELRKKVGDCDFQDNFTMTECLGTAQTQQTDTLTTEVATQACVLTSEAEVLTELYSADHSVESSQDNIELCVIKCRTVAVQTEEVPREEVQTSLTYMHITEDLPDTSVYESTPVHSNTLRTQAPVSRRDKKMEFITTTIQRVKSLPEASIKKVLAKKTLLKLISAFYNEKQSKTEPFSQSVFRGLLAKYVVQSVAENKFKQLIRSCVKYRKVPSVHIFNRFLGIYDELSPIDLAFFLKTADQLGCFKKEAHAIPLNKALEAVRTRQDFWDMTQSEQMSAAISSSRRIDPTSKRPCVLVDDVLDVILKGYLDSQMKTERLIMSVFEFVDVSSSQTNYDGYLQWAEFAVVLKYFSSRELSESALLFKEFADVETEDEQPAISAENFIELVKKTSLLDLEKLSELPQVDRTGLKAYVVALSSEQDNFMRTLCCESET